MHKKSENILITGITGLLGNALVQGSGGAYNIVGVYIGDYSMNNRQKVRYYIADVRDRACLESIFKEGSFDAVIHTAGIANVDYCQNNFRQGYESNVLGTKNIIDLCIKHDTMLVYVSTNAIFDGKNPSYRETDAPNPINSYGEIKLECERSVLASMENFIIVRPILMYGWNLEYERLNFVTWLLKAAKNKKEINLVNDVYENPLFSRQCADIIWKLIEKKKKGIYHVAGKGIVSRHEAGIMVCEVFDLDKKLIKAVSSSYFPDLAPRPKNTSYLTEKIEKELGINPMSFVEGLESMKNTIGIGNNDTTNF